MASQYGAQLLSIGRSMVSWSNRFVKFLRHRMLTQKKNILILGDEQSPIYTKLYPQLAKSWEIVHIAEQAYDIKQSPRVIHQSDPIKDVKQNKKGLQVAKANTAFRRIYLNNKNYQQIEKQLEGKQFDSIVVLPKIDDDSKVLQIQDEKFATHFPEIHQELLMRNLFAYRLASKCLTSTGVIILSISQNDFTKEYQQDQGNQKKALSKPIRFSNELIDAQASYLGVVIGDRDYTDLNSWSIIALSKEISEEEPETVAKYYKIWADSQQLPMPGTFALFKKKDAKNLYVQYL